MAELSASQIIKMVQGMITANTEAQTTTETDIKSTEIKFQELEKQLDEVKQRLEKLRSESNENSPSSARQRNLKRMYNLINDNVLNTDDVKLYCKSRNYNDCKEATIKEMAEDNLPTYQFAFTDRDRINQLLQQPGFIGFVSPFEYQKSI